MGEQSDEATLGQRAHPQQRDTRASQMPTHYGSGRKAAQKVKYMSTLGIFDLQLNKNINKKYLPSYFAMMVQYSHDKVDWS